MGAVPWFPRCVPGLSCVFIVLLVLAALVDPSWWLQLLGWHRPSGSPSHGHQRTADQWTFPQLVLVIYTILIHCLALNFPLRLCWATRQTTVQLKQALTKCADLRGVHGIKSEVSVSLMPSESTALLNAIEVPYNEDRHAGRGVTHVILLPSYKEEIETLRESLDVLASHAAAREHYDVSPTTSSPAALCKSDDRSHLGHAANQAGRVVGFPRHGRKGPKCCASSFEPN